MPELPEVETVVRTLAPSLTETIEKLAGAGTRHMLVVPVSFVTEHIETLHEINIQARARAESLRVERFAIMPALGDSPRFIAALADLVLCAVAREVPHAAEVE